MDFYQLILLLSITTTLLPISLSSTNDKYNNCSTKFTCGGISNIGYPFYDGSTRPDYCGYPGFQLDCSEDPLLITISGKAYNVESIDSNAYNIKVSRTDNWKDYCPDNLVNTTMDYSKFTFSSADQNITFLYDCGDSISGLSITQICAPGQVYYLSQAMVDTHPGLWQVCKSLFLPVLESQIINNLQDVISALEAGFDLGLIAENEACSRCTGSGGVCGYDSGSDKFVCHCATDDFYYKCGFGQVRPPKQGKKNVVPIAIGVSAGAVVLLALLGSCLLFTRRRRNQLVAQDKSRAVFAARVSSNDGGGPHASTPGSNGLTSSQDYTNTPSTFSQTTASYMSSRSDIGKSTYFGVHVFDYIELEHATNNFDESKELGDGGFGTVYYGVLPDGREVAVKRLYENSFKRVEQYINEIRILAEIKHRNLVALYGCTSKKSRELLLVYEFVANGTVADHLHGKLSHSTFLRWPSRLNIAVETAEALSFLHRKEVIHRDVKTTNILLDEHLHVKVGDFGLSRLFPTDMTHVSTAPQGTPGYVDPEYYHCYRLTEKSDVYSFGVVLIELISSKQAVDITRHRHDVNLASMAVDRIQNCALHELVDPRLDFDKDLAVQSTVKMVAELGFQCLQPDREMRPTMDEVLARLKAVQLGDVKEQKQEVVDIIVYADDIGLLTAPTPPLSPELPRSNDVV